MLLQQTNHALSLLASLFRQLSHLNSQPNKYLCCQPNDRIALKNFNLVWSFGLILFGFHLILVGFISLKVIFILKVLAYLVILAGISYCLVHSFDSSSPSVESVAILVENVLTLLVIIGELGLCLWLIFKGR
ncbi:DUF4386 domain-containing protein [Fundicoccus sp. Sow4_H7]|uniref:DUF4386 domain-containing protein n=1 Tax=Fundicoccus sp. Sow4_H7 TaxID=3438784 RepID=UPI003F92C849